MSATGEDTGYTPSATATTSYMPANAPAYEPITLGLSGSKHQASKNQANLTRAQWDDYMNRFAPIENEVISDIGNPQYYASEVGRATGAVQNAYGTQAGQYERNLSRYGATPSADETANAQRQYGLSAATATAQAANQTRQNLRNREFQIVGGGLVPQNPTKQQA